MELNNIIFLFLLLTFGYFLNTYALLLSKKFKFNLISDNQFDKPQAFHKKSTYRIGGITIYLLLSLIFLYLFFFKNIFYFEYISFITLFFFLGLADDLKVDIPPKFRLLIMLVLLMTLIIQNDLYIKKTGLEFLNNFLEIDIFSLFFVSLCFLFIINGSNLIDGFNGLLAIHSLIILIILLFINFINGFNDLAYILFYSNITIIIFLKFNFPRAKMFLGDSGAYLIGILIALSIIKTSILNPNIHPFFFSILLFYLFFEVFFSFFRKLFFESLNPLLPDNKHLHMLIYKLLKKINKKKSNLNHKVTLYINLIYFILIIPGVIFMENGLFCRYYFFSLLIFYIIFYKKLCERIK
tara:strand:- start:70 stop:1128 length:1059 start_codon:yes stop_codon:yes gene_type:complete